MDQMKDDGGPAFPLQVIDADSRMLTYKGMSLRDWFAGQALGMLVAGSFEVIGSKIAPRGAYSYATLAEACYAMADAMLEARKR